MRRYDSDLLTDILKITNDSLNKSVIKIKNNYCICVVLTSNGYPKKYKKDSLIENIKIAENIPGIKIFHSGTRKEKNKFFSNRFKELHHHLSLISDDKLNKICQI